jgi:hypothetical protein
MPLAAKAPNVFRKGVYGAWMSWDQYETASQYGREVNHIMQLGRGGSDSFSNLQPLQWGKNCKKGHNRWWSTEWPAASLVTAGPSALLLPGLGNFLDGDRIEERHGGAQLLADDFHGVLGFGFAEG